MPEVRTLWCFILTLPWIARWGHCLERGGTLLFGPKGCVPLNMVWVQQKTNSKSAKMRVFLWKFGFWRLDGVVGWVLYQICSGMPGFHFRLEITVENVFWHLQMARNCRCLSLILSKTLDPISQNFHKTAKQSFFSWNCIGLPSHTRRFHSRSRPFVWLFTRSWLC